MMSYDAKLLFISIPLNKTVEIILELICDWKEIKTDIPKITMKKMLLLLTQDVYFLFEDDIYQQTDGVALGSPFGPILPGIFVV